ncbi:MAG: CPBP family intramembrane glutamic endopeptidase [Chloroflexia bacterium]
MNNPNGDPQPTTPAPNPQGEPTTPVYPAPPPAQPMPYQQAPPPPPSPPFGDSASPTPPRREIGRQTLITGAILAVALISAATLLAFTGQLGDFFSIGIVFLPLAALAAFAWGGTKNTVSAVFAYIMLAIVILGLFVNSLTYVVLGFVRDSARFNQLLSRPGALDPDTLGEIFEPGVGAGLLIGLLLLFLAILLSAAMLLKPVRVAISRIVPIDPHNFVHKIALSVLTMILLSSFIPLIVLGGRPPLLKLVSDIGDTGTNVTGSDSDATSALSTGPEDLIYQFVWTIPVALIAAGWPIARRIRPTLERLGFVRPTLAQVGFGIGFGVVLAFAAIYLIDPGITWLWRTLGWPTTDVAAFEKLLANLITPLGAILIGVTAGVGEEMAVRGLLQPRIGLIASNLVFTGLHAFQYGPDGLLSVFIIGLILGIIRARTNTTTSAIVHGIYDFVLVMWTVILAGQ